MPGADRGAEVFASDDKYRLQFGNLIAQLVGLEFAGHIRRDFRGLADVRVGPSSRKLPASRVPDWSKERRA